MHLFDPAPEHVLATHEAGDIGDQRLGVHVVGGRSLFDVAVGQGEATHKAALQG